MSPNQEKASRLLAEAFDPQHDDGPSVHGTPRKQAKHVNKQVLDQRVKVVIKMLLSQFTMSEIKEVCAKSFRIKRSSVIHYIRRARARMRWLVNKEAEDVAAESVGFYARMIKRSAAGLEKCEKAITEQREIVREAQRFILEVGDTRTLDPQQRHEVYLANLRIVWAEKAIGDFEGDRNRHRADSILARNQIDRILGSYAPIRVAQTDSKGNDLKLNRPYSQDEIDAQLREIIAGIKAKSTAPTPN